MHRYVKVLPSNFPSRGPYSPAQPRVCTGETEGFGDTSRRGTRWQDERVLPIGQVVRYVAHGGRDHKPP